MTVSNDGPLCFVVTRNHGSLIDTMLFLHGTELLERSVLLLPPELYATHRTGLTARVREYNSFSDLLHWIDVERPSLVFLFCGYLLSTTGLLSPSELKRFLRHLEQRGCLTLTNDPCWGLLASKMPMTLGVQAHNFIQKLHRAWVEWLISHRLRQSYRILNELVHCYPVSVEPTIPAHELRTVGYFNTRLVGSFDLSHELTSSANAWSRPMDSPFWLFILGREDYDIQVNLHGRPAFIDSLVARLRDANDAGRSAVLIAPNECLAGVKQFSDLRDAVLISFCDYRRYVSLLLFAEYAFYWNVASSSGLYRLVNSLPVFFFDRGHVSRWFRSFFERTVELVYRGHTPTILDHREPLIPSRLKLLAEEYRQLANEIVRQLKLLPAPEEMVARLLKSEPSRQGRS
jgi:hypothetical protein